MPMIKRVARKSGRQLMNLPEYNGPRKVVNPGKGSADFLAKEAAGSRIRQRSAEIDPEDARKARLKARITLPTVKGYWE